MSEVYTRTTHQSAGSNLVESIKSFLVGILLFLASFPVLWVNEGCTDMSEVAKTATVVKADNPGSTGEGKLISATADLKVDEMVGDPDMLVPGAYVKLHRKAEMFAWKEKLDKKVEKKLGGGSVTTETATYDKVWTDSPANSDSFKVPVGHRNPSMTIQQKDFYATKAKVGAFSFSPKDCDLPPATDVALTSAMVKGSGPQGPKAPPAKPAAKPGPATAPSAKATAAPKASASADPAADEDAPALPGGALKLVGRYLFRGRGTPEDGGGMLGDVRVTFQAVMPGKQITLYGKRTGTTVVAFVNEKDDKLFRAYPGTHEQAIAGMHGEHVMQTWIVRIGGFLAMWIGLGMILSPINAVLDIVPFIGSAGRAITSIAMFPVALILSGVTILVSIVAHSTILLVLTILVFAGGLTALIMIKRKKAPAQQVAPAGGMPPMGYQGGPPQGGPPQGYGGPPQGGYGPPPGGGGYGPPPGGGAPPGGGGYGPPPGGGGYGPPPGGGGYGPPPGGGAPPGGGGYGGPPQGGGAPPGGGGYGGPPQGGGAPPGGGGYGPPQGGGGYGPPPA